MISDHQPQLVIVIISHQSAKFLPKYKISDYKMNSILEHLTFVSENEYTRKPKLLQKGGIGQVYLATATKNTYSTCCKKHSSFGLKAGNQYAVKFFIKTQAGASNNKEDIIDVSTQVPGLCKVYFYDSLTPYEKDYAREVLGIDQKLYEYCIMEYIDGHDLHDLMSTGKQFMEKEIKSIIKQVLTSLSHLHDMGFCHRDVKLENVIYKHTCQTKDPHATSTNDKQSPVVDGIPREVSKHMSRNGSPVLLDAMPVQKRHFRECVLIDLDTISSCQQSNSARVGTDYYLSPELRAAYASKRPVSQSMWRGGDRFALAVMLYELYHIGRMDDSKAFAVNEEDVPDFKVPVSDNMRRLYWALVRHGSDIDDSDYFLSFLD